MFFIINILYQMIFFWDKIQSLRVGIVVWRKNVVIARLLDATPSGALAKIPKNLKNINLILYNYNFI